MSTFRVGFIYTRCFIQKELQIREGVVVKPMIPTGSRGELHNVRDMLNQAGFSYTIGDLEKSIHNFKETGQAALIIYESVEASSFKDAVDSMENEAESTAGALGIVSANPTIPVCAFAQGKSESGLKLYLPADSRVKHVTNVHGYLDAVPDITKRALTDSKYALLLRLYRASLRETEIDNQILFQLVLLEEASDQCAGSSFAERLRNFCTENKLEDNLKMLGRDLEFEIPAGRDIIDAVVKLRNSCAHNGKIDRATLAQYDGEWLFPVLDDKPKLHELVRETIRYMFCALVGHSREQMATKIELKPGKPFELKF